ncbi:MAG: type II secretion system F family protein [Planctomycetes bacterium]|nr:type II secretion system F family protein [Planctomycetota bacterium]
MPQFQYRAKNAQGKIITGNLNAQNETDAISELRRQGLTILGLAARKGGLSTNGEGGKTGEKAAGFFSLSLGKRAPLRLSTVKVKTNDMVVFTRQLSTMISSGIPLVEALEILADQTSNMGFRGVLENVVSEVRTGKDLSTAMSKFSRVFPKIYVNMIKAGEASGQLDVVLLRLAEYQESAAQLKAEIKSAMTYPVISLVMVLGITIFLLVFIIPKFEEMFNSMNVDLPKVTKALLATSLFLKKNFLMCSLASVAAGVALTFYSRTDKGGSLKDWALLRMPIFGPLFLKVALSRFSRTFGTLIQSGVPILGALEIVAETSGNRIIANAITKASESVRQGETLGEPLARSKIFPLMVTRMISIGEKSGALESLLGKIADFYDQQVKSTVEGLTSLIEPLLIGIMGFLVGGMVMAIFLPIFKMVGSLSGKG